MGVQDTFNFFLRSYRELKLIESIKKEMMTFESTDQNKACVDLIAHLVASPPVLGNESSWVQVNASVVTLMANLTSLMQQLPPTPYDGDDDRQRMAAGARGRLERAMLRLEQDGNEQKLRALADISLTGTFSTEQRQAAVTTWTNVTTDSMYLIGQVIKELTGVFWSAPPPPRVPR